MMNRTVVIGASTQARRYAYQAVLALQKNGHEVFPIGIKEGEINGLQIITDQPPIAKVDTITMYLSQKKQAAVSDYILRLKPRRIIFNPGAENDKLAAEARSRGIEVEYACTLVLLRTNQY